MLDENDENDEDMSDAGAADLPPDFFLASVRTRTNDCCGDKDDDDGDDADEVDSRLILDPALDSPLQLSRLRDCWLLLS